MQEPDTEHHEQEHGSLRAYVQCLKTNRHFRLLWIAETIDNVGSWLNFVAVLTLVEKFSNQSSLAVSAVVLIRFLPSLVLAPVCGVVADRCNRVRVLLVASLLDALVVASLALVQHPSQVWLLYLLLAAQFTCISFYDPARKAMIPVVVPPAQLHLATTIDSFAWSLTGAVGASVGGLVASKLGNSMCFLLDSLTYLVAFWCAYQLPRSLGSPGAAMCSTPAAPTGADAPAQLKKRQSDKMLALELTQLGSESEIGADSAGEGQPAVWLLAAAERRSAAEQGAGPSHPTRAGRRHTVAGGRAGEGLPSSSGHHPDQPQLSHLREDAEAQGSEVPRARTYDSAAGSATGRLREGHDTPPRQGLPRLKDSDAEELPLRHAAHLSGGGSGGDLADCARGLAADLEYGMPAVDDPGGGVLRAAVAALRDAVVVAWEGWQYVTGRDNRDVAAMVSIKCCGSLVWGAVDVLNVRFSQMPSMQRWGDSSVTLGLIFATVGFGCFVGPISMNAIVPPRPQALAWGVAASFGFLFCGFLMMLVAPNILLLLLSTFVRSIGSATLWIYSTLLLQMRVPNAILGRMSAVEMALYTITEAGSSVFGGAAFDVLHLSLQQTLAMLTVVSGLTFATWVAFAVRFSKWGAGAAADGDRPSRVLGAKGYAAVATEEEGRPV